MNAIQHFLSITPIIMLSALMACNSGKTNDQSAGNADSTVTAAKSAAAEDDATSLANANPTQHSGGLKQVNDQGTEASSTSLQDEPYLLVYYFHVKIRCVTCLNMEAITRQTLHGYFQKELNGGRIKFFILNLDDEANKGIAEKYQAVGSGLFITRVFKGRETTVDLTADGFKYAGGDDNAFSNIIKAKIAELMM